MGSEIKKEAERIASGSTFLEISGKMLGNLEISMPSSHEQDKIAGYFESLDHLITLHQRKPNQFKLDNERMTKSTSLFSSSLMM